MKGYSGYSKLGMTTFRIVTKQKSRGRTSTLCKPGIYCVRFMTLIECQITLLVHGIKLRELTIINDEVTQEPRVRPIADY